MPRTMLPRTLYCLAVALLLAAGLPSKAVAQFPIIRDSMRRKGVPPGTRQPIAPILRGGVLTAPPGNPPAAALSIQQYLDGLPKLQIRHPSAPVVRNQDVLTAAGNRYNVQSRSSELLNQKSELAFLSPSEDVLWPGAMIQGMTLGGNDLAPLTVERAGGTMTIATNIVAGNASAPRSLTVPVASFPAVDAARVALLNGLQPQASAGAISYQAETARSSEQAMVKFGVSFSHPEVSADFNMSLEKSTTTSSVFVKFTQVYYTVTFTPDAQSRTFSGPNVTLADVQRVTNPANPPVYVSQVSYGRMFVFQLTSDSSLSDLEASAKAKASSGNIGGSASLSVKQRAALSSASVKVMERGGSGARFLVLPPNGDVFDAIRAYVASGADLSLANPGAAIAIKTRYVGSVGQGMADQSAVAGLITTVTDVIGLHNPVESYPMFQIWDGVGGGPRNTQIPLSMGDEVTINASGENWSGYILTSYYGPGGWTWWPAPPEADRATFPISNISPFGLIARIGTNPSVGYDFNPNRITQRRWFPIGQGFEGAVTSVGQLWLGTNDNNPLNVDAAKKFFVYVTVKRKIPSGVGSTM